MTCGNSDSFFLSNPATYISYSLGAKTWSFFGNATQEVLDRGAAYLESFSLSLRDLVEAIAPTSTASAIRDIVYYDAYLARPGGGWENQPDVRVELRDRAIRDAITEGLNHRNPSERDAAADLARAFGYDPDALRQGDCVRIDERSDLSEDAAFDARIISPSSSTSTATASN